MKKTAILSIVLCLCMVLSLVMPGVSAFASASEAFPGASSDSELAPGNGAENDTADKPAGSDDTADKPAGSDDTADKPAGSDDTADKPVGGDAETPDTPDAPAAEKVVLTIKSWEVRPLELDKAKVAVNQEGLTVTDWALIIYNSDYKGACVEGAKYGMAIVVKDGKIVRAYNGTNGQYHDAENSNGVSGVCTTDNYATVAFESLQEGEILIIAPNSTENNSEPGSRWYIHRYGRGIGNEVVLEGVTFPEPEKPTEPEQPDVPTANEIKVTTTDTYNWIDKYPFTAEVAGKYSFNIPAGLGVHNLDTMISNPFDPPYIDFYDNENGYTLELDLTAGQTITLVFGSTKKADWTVTWTVEAAEGPAKPATSGQLDVTTTDTYNWIDKYPFTAEVAGKYSFTIPAGLGVHNLDIMISNPFDPPYIDFYDNENGYTLELDLTAGQTITLVFGSTEKTDWTITWTCEPAGEQPKENIAVLGENSIVIENGAEGAEYTFVVDKAGDYTFASNDLMIQVLDANGMMLFKGKGYLEPGTYTLKCGAMGATGTFKLNITVVYPKVTAQLGENFITIEEGTEGTEVEFVVDKAGTYTFKGDLIVNICDANGNQLGRGQKYLEPGTYILKCASIMGSGTFKVTIVTDAYDAPKVQIGENTITIENADNGIEATLEVTEAGYYQFSTTTEGVYVRVIVKDANGDQVFVNEGELEAGTYTLTIVFTNDDAECQAGEFNLTVAAKVELQGDVIEELPTTITGTSGDDLYFNYTATEDCIIDIIIVSGDPLISLNTDDITFEDLENGKRVTLKAGQSVIINPWNASMDFEIAVSIYDPETEIGGTQNPEALDNTKTELTLTGDANGYNFTWTAGKDGKVTFTLADAETLEGKQITVNGTALTLEAKTVTIDVTAGDVIAVVCTAEGTTVAVNVAFEEKVVEPDPTQPTTPPTTGTEPTQPTTGGATEPGNDNTVIIIVVIVVVVIAAAVVAVVVLKKKK